MLALYPDPATLDIAAWCQTVTVEPNTKYYLSFFYNKISPLGNNTNRFGLLMDGILVANAGSEIFSNNTCKWYPAAAFWTSGSNTSVEFCIIEFATPQSPTKFVGPFAIDDIVMRALCTVQDTVKVYVKPLTIAPSANLTVPCAGSPITINATNGSSTGNFISYEWSTPNGNIASGANTLTPTINQPGNYWLDLKFQSSTHTCDLKTGFVVKEGPTLLVNILQTKPLTCFGSTISLKALPNFPSDLTYAWSAGGGGNIVSGSNTATPIINQPGLYKVLITNTKNGCTATSEYEVQPPPPPPQPPPTPPPTPPPPAAPRPRHRHPHHLLPTPSHPLRHRQQPSHALYLDHP